MKKAFTLVELAIVLVIIGILLSFVVKGKKLIFTAQFIGDVAKLRRMERFYYEERTRGMTDAAWNATSYFDHPFEFYEKYITQERILTWKEVTFSSFPGLKMFIGGHCGFTKPGSPSNSIGYNCTDSTDPSYNGFARYPAIYFIDAPQDTPPSSRLWYGTAPKKFVCLIEKAADDTDLINGYGGGYIRAADVSPKSAFNDCDSFGRNGNGTPYDWDGYSWKTGRAVSDSSFMWYIWFFDVPSKL